MNPDEEPVTVVIIESQRSLTAECLDLATATTLIALISDDPADWEEAMSVWRRYRTPAVCEFVSGLQFEPTDRSQLEGTLHSAGEWVAIDFQTKRLLTGGRFMKVGRDAMFAMVVEESGKQRSPLSVHLPPWWELHEGVSPELVSQPRQSPINRPYVDRNLLYGDVLLANIATQVLDVVSSDSWRNGVTDESMQAQYPFTVAVHRQWLMTPLKELNGRMPRESLHGAIEWSDRVTSGQRMRFEDGGPMVAAPNDWAGFATAPMGSQEMCLYFDLCRNLIKAGWYWCESDEGQIARKNPQIAVEQLAQFLGDVKDDWLTSSFEGGSPPEFIIDCDRRRVPRGAGVAIEGMDQVQSEQHMPDCDCPICEMMADGMFGVGFSRIDGHHLELDDEFAFSMKQTREEWEEQQREFEAYCAEMDHDRSKGETDGDSEDPFSPVWTGIQDNDEIPEDSPLSSKRPSHWMMAFKVAEVVSKLENLSENREEIKSLNECFANFRRCDQEHRTQRATELKVHLQLLAERYPSLVSRSADLQSHIDEALRFTETDDSEFDMPF